MKKTLLLTFFLFHLLAYSQKDKKNEIKFNLPYIIAGLPEVNYERIIDSTRAVGIAVAFAFDKPDDIETRFRIIPYYRKYFRQQRTNAAGFFVEGNLAVINKTQWISYETSVEENNTYFGVGAAVGYKFLNKNNITAEAFGGLGLELDCCDDMFYPRVGVTIGKRF
jgi:hypothetical protein